MTGPFAFENLISEAKEKITLSWIIGETDVLDVLRGKKLTEDMVEVIPENVNNAWSSYKSGNNNDRVPNDKAYH